MKTFRRIGTVLFTVILCANFLACSSDPIIPEVTVDKGKEDYFVKNMDFDSSAGEKTFSFNSNVEWSVSVASTMNGETWCTVTPSSGKNGNNTIRVKVQENTGYDDRNVVLTLTAGSTLTKTITVTQKQKDAILLTTNKFEVEPQGGKINIEVKANVDYEAIISESCKSWISLASKSRGLTTSNITFDIAETEEYDKREGEIIIKSGNLSEIVHVYQTGREILLLTKNEYTVSDKGETISVEIKSNFSFDVEMPNVDWVVDESKSRGVSSHTLYYTILPNETYDNRETEIIFYDKNSSIKDTLKIIQAQKDAIIISKKNIEVESKGGIIEVELNANVDFDITIDSTWVRQTEQEKSRALVNHKLYFQIDENSTFDARSAHIVMSDMNQSLIDTITICQTQKDTIIIDKEKFNVSAFDEKIEILIKSNIDYKIIVQDDYLSWIKEDNQTRGLKSNNHSYLVEKNMSFSSEPRIGYIILESKLGRDSISVIQEAPIFVENAGNLINIIDIDSIEGYHKILLTGYLNGDDITIIKRMLNLKNIDMSGSTIVSGGQYLKTKDNTIPSDMFWGHSSIVEILLPNNIVEIEKAAFAFTNIEKISFPSTTRIIGWHVFSGCKKLSKIEFNEGLEIIKPGSCRGHLQTEIILPSTLKEIGTEAFIQCPEIKTVRLKASPKTLQKIDKGIFDDAIYGQATLYIPQGTKETYYWTDFGRFANIVEE